MKEIEFRVRGYDDVWYYGLPTHFNKTENTCAFQSFDNSFFDAFADRKTLCQYTGLKDKNGEKIFEGDIVKILYTDWTSKSENDTRTLEEYLDSLTKVGVVCWDNLSLCYHLKMKNYFNSIHCGEYGYIEVIGNIYDNPELLEN